MKKITHFDGDELVSKGVISRETADAIQAYYSTVDSTSPNRLNIAFGILGSLLVGSGIILMLAHNWDQLSRLTKTIIAFIPVITPQLLIGYLLAKKKPSVVWRESTAVLLTLGVGTSISLISQIYHIPGDIDSFMLTWILLVLPLIYIVQSSATNLLYIAGVTIYSMLSSDHHAGDFESLKYILLLSASLPHYLSCIRTKPLGNFTVFQHWFYALSPIFVLGFFVEGHDSRIGLCYLALFATLISIGSFSYFEYKSIRINGYSVIGSLGFIVIMTMFGFDYLWNTRDRVSYSIDYVIPAGSIIAAWIILFISVFLAGNRIRISGLKNTRPELLVFLLFIPVYFIGNAMPAFAQIATNFLILGLGISIAYRGAKQHHLGFMNYGLLITVLLAICRFFDDELSFVLRGTLFVAVGIGFFVSNYLMIRKKRQA